MYQTDQYEGMIAETVSMKGLNGDAINAYGHTLVPDRFPAWTSSHAPDGECTESCTRRLAHHGSIPSPNLYFRDGPARPRTSGPRCARGRRARTARARRSDGPTPTSGRGLL